MNDTFKAMTFKVTKKSERDGKPGQCYYCNKKIGETHEDDCVFVRKDVVVEIRFFLDQDVPAFWGENDCKFYFEKKICVNDLFKGVVKVMGDHDKCKCDTNAIEVKYIGSIKMRSPYVDED